MSSGGGSPLRSIAIYVLVPLVLIPLLLLGVKLFRDRQEHPVAIRNTGNTSFTILLDDVGLALLDPHFAKKRWPIQPGQEVQVSRTRKQTLLILGVDKESDVIDLAIALSAQHADVAYSKGNLTVSVR